MKVLPSITTLGLGSSSWSSKIEEIPVLGIKEVALFLTGLSPAERYRCLKQLFGLKKRYAFSIPFVHAVTTMTDEEYTFLSESFGVERFNLHPPRELPLSFALRDSTRARIYIENCGLPATVVADDLRGFAGLCIDLTHLEDARQYAPSVYDAVTDLCSRFPVGANHVSAFDERRCGDAWPNGRSLHVATADTTFKYLSEIDRRAISDLIAVELENSLAEQVTFLPQIRGRIEQALSPETLAA